ncbi:helix-turn-helix transcriptional regulator [Halalkalicoccus ordinarius]|uniref:helix-turn-helix transcriptional regulator n=1 Tax=Halalkalicoccus ordinarius TaxID=3116651 RepID=UPI00300EBA04
MDASPTDRLSDLPPSAKLVFVTLKRHGSLTQREIREESLLVARTARYALSRLEEEGLIEVRISFRDARQRIYTLSEAGETAAQPAPA